LIITAALLTATLAAQESPGRRIAITFDDLPMSRSSAPVAAQESVTAALLHAIRRGRVPAIGFVNENKLRDSAGVTDPRRVRLLAQWLDAHLELGNHTFSHRDLHTTSLRDFEADLVAGEAITRPLLAARGLALRYFRHPYLHTGRTLAVRDSLEAFLDARGYRVAPVTVDNSDYVFARAYDRARDRGDLTAAGRITTGYLDYMTRVLAFYERQSVAIVGREIPQVLLLHASALNAAAFPGLMRMLAARGYTTVPLEQALADPAYRSADRYSGPAGISWLQRWALTLGLPRSIFRGEPEVPGWVETAAGE
jgi:peptidoglycan/xylan/chitin deacetylase (PgdA/CDA1 family)